MKTKLKLIVTLLLLSTINHQLSTALAQGTAFTYQGRLNDGANVANGTYDLTFALFSVNGGAGGQVGSTLTNSTTGVSNGLFTVMLDFGANFPGADRWLEIGVRTNGVGAFTTLSPRQKLTPTPYAITAENVVPGAGLSGTYGSAVTLNNTANQFTGTFTGNGGGLTNLNVATLGGLTSSNFWQLGGNNVTSGKFLGSTNNQPVEIWANNRRVVQLAYASNSASGYSPNVVLGNSVNFVSNGVVGATVLGGGVMNGSFVPSTNRVLEDFGTVVGGYGNMASGKYSVAMGFRAIASGSQSTALGGASATGDYSTAAGNSGASGKFSTAMGSSGASLENDTAMGTSQASGSSSTAMGFSTASGEYATAMGHSVTTNDNDTAMGASTAGGFASTAMGNSSASGDYSTAMGKSTARGSYSTAGGGYLNSAAGEFSFAAGNGANALYDGDFAWADSQPAYFYSTAKDQFCIRAQGGVQLDPTTSLFFGNRTRQMLNLYGTGYGIGVQNYVTYFRSGEAFAWFQGGVHSDTSLDPGAGGTLLMELDLAGDLFLHGSVSATTFYSTSDRNAKAGFEPVAAKTILEKVAALPITRWHFINDMATTHLGPMAQDFYAAFNVGPDDKHIATVDEGGVALAAIQGLNQKLEEQRAENAELKQRLDALETIIHHKK